MTYPWPVGTLVRMVRPAPGREYLRGRLGLVHRGPIFCAPAALECIPVKFPSDRGSNFGYSALSVTCDELEPLSEEEAALFWLANPRFG